MPLEVGVCLGPYEILAAIGRGGMGEVYRARDRRLERDVAVKILPTHFKVGSTQLARFEREARLLASLNHPSICAIYDIGSERAISFIVMEHLLGETLAARIERGPISPHVALRYAIQIIDALGAAHSAGLVHRDIKPSNIMLTTTGVKLLDFGLAKRHMAAAPAADRTGTPTELRPDGTSVPVDLTAHEGIVGTLHYMAPEQLAGREVDGRSDIWAFGCVIYEMVTGRRAFAGKTMSDVIAAIVTERPVVMTMERGVVPLALEHLVARCLARDPSERWQTAADLARELRSMLPHAAADSATIKPESAPIQAIGSGPVQDVVPQTQEQRRGRLTGVWISLAVAALLLAVVGAWFVVGRAPATRPLDSVAVLPFVNASGNADVDYLSEGLPDGIIAELARTPRVRVVPSSAAFHYKSSSDPRSAGQSLRVDRVVTGRVAMQAGRLEIETELVEVATGSSLWSGHYSEPQTSLLSLERELAGGILNALRLEPKSQDSALSTIPAGLNSEAYRLILRGRYASSRRSESSLKSAIGLFTEATAKDSRAAAAYAGLADCYTALARFTMAVLRPSEAFPKAKRAATRALELDPSLADAHLSLGFVKMFSDWDWKGAGSEYDRAVELQPSEPSAHERRAEWLMGLGRSDDALAEARNATRLDPLSVSASFNLGWQLYLARRYADAIGQLQATIKLDPDMAAAHYALGTAYEKGGRLEEAIRELQTASTMSSGKPLSLAGLGYVYGRTGRPVEAKQTFERLRAMGARDYVSPFYVALVAVGLDDRETAVRWLGQAVDDHAPEVASLAVDPRLDPIRSDPRFGDLLKRIGL